MKANKSARKSKTEINKKSTIKKPVSVKQRNGETVLQKIKNVLGYTAAKIKTLLPRKEEAIKKRNRRPKRLQAQEG